MTEEEFYSTLDTLRSTCRDLKTKTQILDRDSNISTPSSDGSTNKKNTKKKNTKSSNKKSKRNGKQSIDNKNNGKNYNQPDSTKYNKERICIQRYIFYYIL